MNEIINFIGSADASTGALVVSLGVYGPWAIFISVFLFGEAAIFVSLLLSQQGLISLTLVFIYAVIGTLSADVFWFFVGRYFPKQMIPDFMKRTVLDSAYSFFKSLTKDKFFLSLLFLKFFVGIRLAIILYIARQKITFVRFFIYDALGTVIYMFLVTILTLGFGKAIEKVVPSYHVSVSIIVGLLLVYFISHLARSIYTITGKK